MDTGPELRVGFYSLLYVSHRAKDGAYLQRLEPDRRIALYLRMALRLAGGVHARFGQPLRLVTNDEPFLRDLLARSADDVKSCLELISFDFAKLDVPETARYFSATHKVSLFEFFAGKDEYSILLDIDMMCREGRRDLLAGFIRDGVPMVYDISDQVFPAHGYGRIFDDLAKFGAVDRQFRWYGGEFIGGGSAFFAELSERAAAVMPRYGEIFQTLHHQGDEIITTHCLNAMRMSNSPNLPLDVGGPDIVRRHHGKATLHDERRLEAMRNIGFLHLPTMKALLASGLSDRAILRFLRCAELLPRRWAGPFLSVSGAMLGVA